MQRVILRLLFSKSEQFWYSHSNLSSSLNYRTCLRKSHHTERYPSANFQLFSYSSKSNRHFNYILQQCTVSGDLRSAKSVHNLLLKFNFSGFLYIWNKLLLSYDQHGVFNYACHLFDEMSQRDVVTYNTIISGYVRHGNAHKGVYLYFRMREENIYPNHITLASLIGAFPLVGLLHAHVIHCGFSCNEFAGSSLVVRYAKQRRLKDAIRAFDEISELDLVSWNIMIGACAANKSKDHALRIFSQMLDQNVEFDGFTLTSVIKTCSEPIDLYYGMLLHGIAIKTGLLFETPLNNSLITMYSKCEEGMMSAVKIFLAIAVPNIISWTAMISGFMQNEQNEEAIGTYRKMLESGIEENDFSFSSVLPSYGNMANLYQGRQIHARIVKSWFVRDVTVNNSLIDMYAKCGSLADAYSVFSTMEAHDIFSYTTMITCFGQHGKAREALDILKTMMRENLIPDSVTFLGCLSACSYSGLLDEGIRVFKIMIDIYHYKPQREHFSCIVDMLSRAGRLKEAERFIYYMGIQSDVLVWETLLGACRIHREMELGEKSAARIMELKPEMHGSYVLLANMYADRELWEDKGVVRERLGAKRLVKEVGSSWVAS
ncbi:hypothetical protein Nepgr_029077 [Nepenthes gracilis]|uniref:Pentatricopeptide repeat-containing protein n=1 Tax=Nepenthes gracilis TaxID=150966 RepID=A0AAD3TDF9_NEPGR|nr:hypothetical protein Nepgr_029077 [Nepenthes gracilis]